jgi:hypothetical protein
MATMRPLFAIGLSLVCASTVYAQADGHAHGGHDPAGLGQVSFANSGAAAAQPSFLRGLALLHSFEYEEAALEGLEPGEDLKSVWRSEVTAKMLGETTLVTIWEPEESDLRVTSIREPGESEIRFVLRHLQLVLATLVDLRELREGRR